MRKQGGDGVPRTVNSCRIEITPRNALKILRQHFDALTPEQFQENLKRWGILERRVQRFPWVIVQTGSGEGGVFRIAPSEECVRHHLRAFYSRKGQQRRRKSETTVVDFFESRTDAEVFLSRFVTPRQAKTARANGEWPASLERPIRAWYRRLDLKTRLSACT